MSAKGKLMQRLMALYGFRDKSGGASTTVALERVPGNNTAVVASATGVTTGKSFRFGDGEDIERVEIQGVSGTTVTFVKPLLRRHAPGSAFVEQNAYDLGAMKGGITVNQATESSDALAGNQRLVFTRIYGYQSFGIEAAIYGLT